MADSENSLIAELREDFNDRFVITYWRKLHGDQFQAGLPDLLVAGVDRAAMVEAKWIDRESHAEASMPGLVMALLTDKQRADLMMLAALNGPLRARVLLGMKVEALELPYNEATLAVAFDFNDLEKLKGVTMVALAERHLQGYLTKVWSPAPHDHLIQAQLRVRGQKWQSPHLILGTQAYSRRALLTTADVDAGLENLA